KEMFGKSNSKFEATIIGVDSKRMDEKWLGFTLSHQTAEKFLSEIQGVDPLGENGEFHTIVTQSPLYSRPFQVEFKERIVQKNMTFLRVHIVEI
ncbi:MAG: ATP pyrophosphatase, partial [Candidatus Bathyarchaeia archaeon]